MWAAAVWPLTAKPACGYASSQACSAIPAKSTWSAPTRPAGSTANVDFTNRSVNSGVDAALVDEMLASMSRIAEKGGSVSLLAARDYDTPAVSPSPKTAAATSVLNLGEDLDRAWSSVGRALEQGEWRVEDINRSLGPVLHQRG
jgi:uncharacterized lipoprotein